MPSAPPQIEPVGGALTPTAPPQIEGAGGSLTPDTPPQSQPAGVGLTPAAPPQSQGTGGGLTPDAPPAPTTEGGTESVAASVTLDPAGADNSIALTAVEAGAAGNDITVEILSSATQETTDVSVVSDAITVTPGSKARMIVSGTLTDGTDPVVFPELYAVEGSPEAIWTSDGSASFALSGDWYSVKSVAAFGAVSTWSLRQYTDGALISAWITGSAPWPPSSGWTPTGACTGTPTISDGTSSAAQVIAAINGNGAASALVTASASGASTGAVAAVSATNLSGGSGTALASPPAIQADGGSITPSAPPQPQS